MSRYYSVLVITVVVINGLHCIMFFVVRSNDSFNFPLGLRKYTVILVVVCYCCYARTRLQTVHFPVL